MIEEIGLITAVDKDHIWVETKINTTCNSCQVQNDCGTGAVAKTFAPKTEQLILRCEAHPQVGQKVKLGIEEHQLLGASALMYLLPLLTLVGSALLGQWILPQMGLQHELWIVTFAFLATFVCFAWLRKHASEDVHQRFSPKLLAILPQEEELIVVKQLN